MIIHVVKQGETINSIAELYGESVDRLILENGIVDADNLVIGETLIILYPETEYTVQPGDTLEGIAIRHNTSILELLRNNPYLSDRQYIYTGEVIVIKYKEEDDDVVVKGAGQEFCDAALSTSRMGLKNDILTMRIDSIED